jgi:hypothetical protein
LNSNDLFGQDDEATRVQADLGIDDGAGLRVVGARFIDESKFTWDLFQGYDDLRVLTYSASADAIIRMLDRFSLAHFECIFGYQGVLRDIKDVLSFQKVAVGDARAAIMGLKDERHALILQRVHEGKARFFVLRKYVAHAKLYLLSAADGRKRVIVGSANLSERAFSGNQSETLVRFDDDPRAWQHYSLMFNRLRDDASDEIALPEERITKADIEITETPALFNTSATLVIDTPSASDIEVSAPVQIMRVEKVLAAIGPSISASAPPIRGGKQRVTPEIKKEISRIRLVKTVADADNRYFSLSRENRVASLSGARFELAWDGESASKDAALLVQYFENYKAFEGNVPRLQRDYFTFMAWLYFSPFICDMRSLALLRDSDIIRFPSFAIIFGKSNCGKTSLVDMLMTSMFGFTPTIEKQSFTAAQLRGLQQAYKRLPVVFDDIGRRAFTTHGRDIIKDEMQPPVEEYPGFVISMNAEPHSFPDEIVKRSLMIYTTTALPPHNEGLRQSLQGRIQEMRRSLTGHLYRRYLVEMLDILESSRLPDDWLELSSGVLSRLLTPGAGTSPEWARPVTWLGYAEKRYDRVKMRLLNVLRPAAYSRSENEAATGWRIEGDKVIVWERRDAFGRGEFEWDDVPSTLVEEDASTRGRTVLKKASTEEFLGHRLRGVRKWWIPWASS